MKNTNVPLTDRFSELNESKEPTHDVIDGVRTVNMTPNPAYSITTSGTQIIKMSPNPAYATSSTVNKAEDPAYICD